MNAEVYTKGACWNYWDCSEDKRNKCGIFKSGSGEECFIMNKFSSKNCREIEDCYSCSWYKCNREE